MTKRQRTTSTKPAPWIVTYEDGDAYRLWHPALWRHIWTMWRGKRLWAARWYLTHRTVRDDSQDRAT